MTSITCWAVSPRVTALSTCRRSWFSLCSTVRTESTIISRCSIFRAGRCQMDPNSASSAMRCRSGAISRDPGTEPLLGVPPPNLARISAPLWARSSSVVIPTLSDFALVYRMWKNVCVDHSLALATQITRYPWLYPSM